MVSKTKIDVSALPFVLDTIPVIFKSNPDQPAEGTMQESRGRWQEGLPFSGHGTRRRYRMPVQGHDDPRFRGDGLIKGLGSYRLSSAG